MAKQYHIDDLQVYELDTPPDAMRLLKEKGCGAFVGREGCNADADITVFCGWQLAFMLYRSVHDFPERGLSTAILCERHAESPIVDMPRAFRREQEREFEKFKLLESRVTEAHT